MYKDYQPFLEACKSAFEKSCTYIAIGDPDQAVKHFNMYWYGIQMLSEVTGVSAAELISELMQEYEERRKEK